MVQIIEKKLLKLKQKEEGFLIKQKQQGIFFYIKTTTKRGLLKLRQQQQEGF